MTIKKVTTFERYYLWLVFVFSLLIFLPYLGSRDFWAPVEPRYAEICRVMFAKGEWIVPTVNGELYTDKPILYFWLALAASKLAGSVNEWTVRMPAALSAVGLVVTVYFLGRDLFTARVGVMAALILATSLRVICEGRWSHMDTLLAFLLTLSLYCFSRAMFGIGRKGGVLFSYGLVSLATLTKGLIGIVLSGLFLVCFITLTREWRRILEWRLPWGIVIFLLIAGPWFAAVSYFTDGKWLEDFIWVHHFQRYTSGAGHREPLYYYLTTLPVDFLPWTFFALPALMFCKPRLKDLWQPLPLFLFMWFSVIFCFFSISDTKRDLYLLPAFPPLALFVAWYFDKLIKRQIPASQVYRALSYILFGSLTMGGVLLPAVVAFLKIEAIWTSVPLSMVLLAGGLIGIRAVWSRQPQRVFICAVLTVALATLSTAIWILPAIDEYKSARPFAIKINEIVPLTEPLYIYADIMNDFNFYTGREIIPVLTSPADVKTVLQKVNSIYLLIRDRNIIDAELTEKAVVLSEGSVGSKRWRLIRSKE